MIASCISKTVVLLSAMAATVPWTADAGFIPQHLNAIGKLYRLAKRENNLVSPEILYSKEGRYKYTPSRRNLSVFPASSSSSSSIGEEREDVEESSPKNALEIELEHLQNQLALIEALEERNKAQLDSFIDEQDQWDSMQEEDRQLLQQNDEITHRMETLAEELVQIWMGAKSMDGYTSNND